MSRYDAIGLFWEDRPVVKEKTKENPARSAPVRTIPPIPDTGWSPPESFPRLDSAEVVALDLETCDPDIREKGPGAFRDGFIAGIAIGVPTGERWYFPIGHERGFNFERESVLAWARHELGRRGQPKIGANLLYDLEFLAAAGVKVEGPFWDVQVAEPLLDENARYYNLDRLAQKYLGEHKVDSLLYSWLAQAFGGEPTRNQQAGRIWRAPAELVGPYAQGDVDLPLRIFAQQRELLAQQSLMPLFDIESALIPMLLAMRIRGVPVDIPRAQTIYDALTDRLQRAQDTHGGIDVYSADDVAKYCDRRAIVYPRTAKGNPSFVQSWLDHHADPVIRAVNEERKARKARDTFVKGYLLDLHRHGRIHCQFNQLKSDDYGTVSGRFSSSNPNLQNIPTRDEEIGPLIRSLFIPEEGEDWASLDWSQIEFRFLCHYGRGRGADRAREQYASDPTIDFHRMVAEMTGVARRYAKNINFGLVYGMGEELMASQLGKTRAEVQPIFDEYHQRLPFVRHTYNEVSRVATNRGYIMTLLGRRRRFDLFAPRSSREEGALPYDQAVEKWGQAVRRAFTHKALNALLQGSAADAMKKAMVDIWNSGVCDVLGAPLLTVHDELDWSKPRTAEADQAINEVKRIMESCVSLRVPVVADMKIGSDWSKCK
jgi:DNA polymerase I-like protein with 3'-5' exonuclease and polymerase domains